jgi:hypothetical protein
VTAIAQDQLFEAAGEVLAELVGRNRDELDALGRHFHHLRATAAYRQDCQTFAVWQAANPEHLWRTLLANARQGHLIRTTAAALNVQVPALIRRGEAAEWLSTHGANLRFTKED